MSNIKISELDQAGALTGFELLPVVQDNLTVRTTLSQVKSFASIAISNDIIGDAASTTLAPSVNAIKTYTDGLVVGLLNDRGNYTPDVVSPGDYPSSGGSGVSGAIQKGDIWFIDNIGFLGTTPVVVGVSVRALVNNASPTTDSDWDILDAGLIQSNLQSVLTAGNTANLTLVLTNNPYTSTLTSSYIGFSNTSGDNSVYNSAIFTIANSAGNYISGSVNNFKVYNAFSNNSTELKYDSLRYNNSGFIGRLSSSTLTSSQTWTLPDATGTLALANNVWNATGNAGTVAGTNFIGTTDAIDFVAKTNNTERLRVLSTGQVKLSSLTGTGTRMVVANSVGQLATQTITSPTLQTVTNAGNTTTNDIISSSLSSSITAQTSVDSASAVLNAVSGETGYLILTTATGLVSTLSPLALTGSRTYFLPDNDGTIALLSDINTSDSWKTIGNAGTTPGADFIGTTDNVDLVFRTDNVEQLRLKSTGGSGNIETPFDIYSKNSTGGSFITAQSTGSNGAASIGWDNTNKGYLTLSNGTIRGSIQAINLTTSDKTYQLPNASGTIALTTTVTLQSVLAGTNKNLTNGINLQGTGAGGGTFSGININAFGTNAAQNNTGSYINALGGNAAVANSGNNINALGYAAAANNTGQVVNALGSNAAENNSGTYVNALGLNAAKDNAGDNVNAFGYDAGRNNLGTYVNAFGYLAAKGNIGSNVNALGGSAAQVNTGSDVNAFGINAGYFNNINGATIFSNASLPSYANYAAASAAITIGAGGSIDCTYLYHDQATNSIGAVRL